MAMTTGLALAEQRALYRRLAELSDFDIGYPNATDLDVAELDRFWDLSLNNVGHPFAPAHGFTGHTLDREAQVVAEVADLFRAPLDDVTGHVTSGSTEAIRAALLQARQRFDRKLVLYASTAAHTCVRKLAAELCLRLRLVPAADTGEMDYAALAKVVARRPKGAAVVVVATIGTTMVEAIDSVPDIHRALDAAGVPTERRFIHSDAALAGLPLATMDPHTRPGFDLADGADSVSFSGHKFLGVPTPCGVVVLRASSCPVPDMTLTYTGAPDLTPAGSRSGHTPLMLLLALRRFGRDGLRRRAEQCRQNADELVRRLVGVPAWRHPLAFTVVLPRPSAALLGRWPLPVEDTWAHVICMPGKRPETYERFAAEYIADLRSGAADVQLPTPRTSGEALKASPLAC